MTPRQAKSSGVIPETSGIHVGDDRYEILDIPAGSSPATLLLLHEGLGSVSTWRDFPYQLAAATGARIVAYSRLGFGKSSARRTPSTARFMHEEAQETLPALRLALALERPFLLGHSTGGSMALLHAAHDPDGVAGVIALAPLVDVEAHNLATIREARTLFENTAWRDKLARHHDHPIDEVFDRWNETWLNPGFRDWSIVRELERIRCPVLALVGREDPYSSPRQIRLVAQAVRHAPVRTLELADCGHVPYRDHPHAVLEAIAGWMAA